MSEYRRIYQPGGSYFFTIVTYQRLKFLALPDNIAHLQSAFQKVMGKHPFSMEAFVILPDHIHCIWRLPSGDSDYSTRWRLIKGYFSAKFDYPANEREGGLVDPLRLIHPAETGFETPAGYSGSISIA